MNSRLAAGPLGIGKQHGARELRRHEFAARPFRGFDFPFGGLALAAEFWAFTLLESASVAAVVGLMLSSNKLARATQPNHSIHIYVPLGERRGYSAPTAPIHGTRPILLVTSKHAVPVAPTS
jgi:hypothetical protein